MFDQILSYENKFFVNGKEVIGIDSLDISYSNSSSTVNMLGFNSGTITNNGPQNKSLSLSQYLISTGGMYEYLNPDSNSGFSGSINYNNNSYGFKSGYISEYIVNCAVGSIPRITSNIIIFDDLQSGVNSASGDSSIPIISIPNQGSIHITCDNSTTNRVTSFDYSAKRTYKPIYSIGSLNPASIQSVYDTDYSATVQIDVDDAFLQNSKSFISDMENKTLQFSILDRSGASSILNLSIPRVYLISESLSSSADGGIKLTLNYKGRGVNEY